MKKIYLFEPFFFLFFGLFHLFAIAVGLGFRHDLIIAMIDVDAWYRDLLWGGFIALGAAVFGLGVSLLIKIKKANDRGGKNI